MSNSGSNTDSSQDHPTSSTQHPPQDSCGINVEAEQYHPSSLASDIYQGLGGMYAGAKAVALQSFKQSSDDYHRNVERSWRCGLLSLGYKPSDIDAEINELRGAAGEDEDVDNSVKVQGDTTTHIHMAPGSALPNWIASQSQIEPKQSEPSPTETISPVPPPVPTTPNKSAVPTWMKLALGLAIGTSAGGPALVAYLMKQPPQESGGSIFRFRTELPPWMQDDEE